MHSTINEAAKKPRLWIPFLGAVPPALIPIGIIGGLALAAIMAFRNRKYKNQPLPSAKMVLPQPSSNRTVTVHSTAGEPLDLTVEDDDLDGSDTVKNISEEEIKQEMIRQTMSELGKRSAQARAKKRLEEA